MKTYTFCYIPGIYPTPMLMYYQKQNQEVFDNEEYNYSFGQYSKEHNHIWNIGAYIIYNDKNEIISYRIRSSEYFLWLLRVINKELIMKLDEKFVKENQDFFKYNINEISAQ